MFSVGSTLEGRENGDQGSRVKTVSLSKRKHFSFFFLFYSEEDTVLLVAAIHIEDESFPISLWAPMSVMHRCIQFSNVLSGSYLRQVDIPQLTSTLNYAKIRNLCWETHQCSFNKPTLISFLLWPCMVMLFSPLNPPSPQTCTWCSESLSPWVSMKSNKEFSRLLDDVEQVDFQEP